jgi:uncharacterized protein YecT (DUF1311 family)
MRGLLIVSLCLAFRFIAPVYQACAETQASLNADACLDLEHSNAEMKRIQRRIILDHKDEKMFVAAFRKAQQAWMAFRDAQLNAVYPESPELYGSANVMCRCFVLNKLTRERIETLKMWLSEEMEGDVCAGSMKRKGR